MTQRRIAIANRKGGCGKTACAVNIAAGLAMAGRKVLLVDCDAQANASISLGFSPYAAGSTLYDLLEGQASRVNQVMQPAKSLDGLFVLPATSQLAAYELAAHTDGVKKTLLSERLINADTAEFDYIILDPPPTVGFLSVMSLIAAREVIIPVAVNFLSMEGLAEMVRFIYQINATVNPELVISGIIPTFFNLTTRLARDVKADIIKNFGDNMVLPAIRQNVSLAEAPGFGRSIFEYAPHSIGAADYEAVVRALESMDASKTGHL